MKTLGNFQSLFDDPRKIVLETAELIFNNQDKIFIEDGDYPTFIQDKIQASIHLDGTCCYVAFDNTSIRLTAREEEVIRRVFLEAFTSGPMQ